MTYDDNKTILHPHLVTLHVHSSSDAGYLRNASTDCLNNLIKNLANSLTTTLSVTLLGVSLQQQNLDSFPFNFKMGSNQLFLVGFATFLKVG